MADDSHGAGKHRDALPRYADKSAEADDAVTISVSTTPGEWLVNTNESVVLPMSMAEVVDAIRAGKLSERSLVWRQGMQEWASIDHVPQLKLAARLPLTRVLSAVTTAAAELAAPPMPASSPRKPPPKPARATPVPQGLSRRSTLPFGIPTQKPPPRPSNPAQLKLTPLPRAASVPPLPSDEPPVLAVYERPAATISFELDQADSVRVPTPAPAPPESLAPTTSDAQPQRAGSYAPPAAGDLALVAAGQLQALRRAAKRLVVASSLASAAAASLLTFWLSQRSAPAPTGAARPLQAVMAPAAVAPATPPTPAITPPEAPSSTLLEPSPAAPAASAKPPSKKARAVRWTPRPTAAPSVAQAPEVGRNPSSEPNPYDVKLEDDAPSEKKSATTRPPATESTSKEAEASAATGSSSPGF
ncbi:MAG TPA: GYF domain-containing protein [Polyangiaceae bacterium]